AGAGTACAVTAVASRIAARDSAAARRVRVGYQGRGFIACSPVFGVRWLERLSAHERERDGACLVGAFDDHGFPACAAVGADAADDRRELAWRRGVQELDRD